jgi:predicted metal-dependent hydrolase
MRVLHPDLSPDERSRLIQAGIDLFNGGRFFAAHEAWEEIWRSTTPEPRDLFQGLIQVAAALHQFLDLQRIEGPRRTLAKARRRLEPYTPAALGIDLEALLEQVIRWESWLERRMGDPPPVPALNRVVDPTIPTGFRTAAASPKAPSG